MKFTGKMTNLSGSKFFGCFEKHPKVVSGALRDGFRARKVFGSFEKRTPGHLGSESRVGSQNLGRVSNIISLFFPQGS